MWFYTYLRPIPANLGYWAVVGISSISPATVISLNEGTANNEYATPLGLAGSKYVREDQASGETVLNANGTERLKATAQGVEVTGVLLVGGSNLLARIEALEALHP